MNKYSIENVRKEVLGNNVLFNTPFGERHLLYADYTASGRGVRFIEDKIINILQSYANTHTEDDYSGKYLTNLLHKAEANIKQFVNAGEHGKIIAADSGTTGALKKLARDTWGFSSTGQLGETLQLYIGIGRILSENNGENYGRQTGCFHWAI